MTARQFYNVAKHIDKMCRSMQGQIIARKRRVSVNWDIGDAEGIVRYLLPQVVEIPDYIANDAIADYLCEQYDFCVESYCFV